MPSDSQKDSNKYSVYFLPISILLSGLLIMVSILYSANSFSKRNELVTKNTLKAAVAEILNGTTTQQNDQQQNVAVKTSIDDDPMMGDKSNAKVAFVEFSDYECPFCKMYFDQTYEQIKKEYVDTGKILYVYRDFPLSFHEPMATYEARAASCVRDQAGDQRYFQFHDLVFKNTKSNGNGLTKDQTDTFAAQTGIDTGKYKDCINSDKFKDEIQKDQSDGSKIGVNGTPGFVIGKLGSDGIVDGVVFTGAQPFAAFKSVIDQQLSR